MSHKPFHIPLRTSSINPRSAGNDTNNQRDSRARSIPKAQRILGTTDIALDSDYHQRPDKRTSRSAGYLSANDKPRNQDGKDDHLQPPSLRVLASSPELGQESRGTPQPTPPLLSLSRKLHLTGSSSGLYSRHTSKEPAVESKAKPTKELDSALDTGNTSEGGLNPAFKQPKGPMKETKRKTRPPRIDLSLLFPKPQPTATRTNDAPLLSPQRMTSSPSAISFASEITTENPLLKTHKSESRLAGKKLTKTPPRQRALSRPETTQQALDGVLNSTIYETPSPVWSNPSLEKTVRTNEMDLALQKNFDTLQTPRSTERAIYSQMNFSMRGRDHTQRSDSKSLLSARSGHSAHSSQRTLREAASLRGDSNKGASMSKKSSKSTLKNSDLNTSSVLCLSSSEDEDDTTQDFKPQFKSGKTKRDSVSTYGGYEAEICTAAAAQATRGTLRSVERPSSSNTQHSRSSSKYLHPQRGPANPLANKSSNGNRRSRRSSGVPAILEPDFLHSDPMFDQTRAATRKPSLSQKEINRRSRLMAVTRQEERLLEVMRTRDGKITPSIFNENFEPDRRSMASALSVPSRDSYYGSDTSFLRLSPSIPPASARTSQATSYKVSGTSTPKGTGSDSEGKTSNPVPSPQASLSSKSLPSPTASTTSPITPTLPIHRFSPLPSQKPPPHLPPPPVPDLHRNHSRRRTDSSGAIAIDDAAPDQRESGEFPVWALGWTSEGGNMTAVH